MQHPWSFHNIQVLVLPNLHIHTLTGSTKLILDRLMVRMRRLVGDLLSNSDSKHRGNYFRDVEAESTVRVAYLRGADVA